MSISPELSYVLLVLGLFLVPRLLQRYGIPGAISSVGIGAALGMGLGLFQGDPTVQWLGTLGIVALFLFAGLEVDFDDLRRGVRVVAQHVVIQTLVLVLASIACAAFLGLRDRAAVLLALALFTPSTGFILDSLEGFGLDSEQRFWVKSKAVASEIVALAILFVTVQSTDASRLVTSSAALFALVAVLPWVFRVFSDRVLPHAPKSEFTFLVIVAMLSAFLTRRLGVYYLVGAFVVGLTAVRMRHVLPDLVTEKVLGAIELFASFFVPFYFLKAGLHLRADDFSVRAFWLGGLFIVLAVPVRVLTVTIHRRFALGESLRAGARVGLSLVPTLVFTMVIAEILVTRYAIDRDIYGALLVFSVGNTLMPGFLLRAAAPVASHGATTEGRVPVTATDAPPDAVVGEEREDEFDDGGDPLLARPVRGSDRLVRTLEDALLVRLTAPSFSRDAMLGARIRQIALYSGRFWAEAVSSSVLCGVGVLLDSVPLVAAGALASPIAAPVGGLALGLAAGSPVLVLRTLARASAGLAGCVAIVALLTRVVPITSPPVTFGASVPTLLDLIAAAACALVAVMAELNAGATTIRIAARAAVGHVLLVPASVAGFALGSGDWSNFGISVWALLAGAATVVVVSLLGFLLLGMHRVQADTVEEHALRGLDSGPLSSYLESTLRRVLATRWGGRLRVLMPITLLLLAAIPLRRALDDVARQIRARDIVHEAVSALSRHVVETRVEVSRRSVDVLVIEVGDHLAARADEQRLARALRSRIGRRVHVQVIAMPDAASLARLESRLETDLSRAPDATSLEHEILARLESEVAEADLGPGQTVDHRVRAEGRGYSVDLLRVGIPSTVEPLESLERRLTEVAGAAVDVSLRVLDARPVGYDADEPVSVAALTARASIIAASSGVRLCVAIPEPPAAARPAPRAGERRRRAFLEALRSVAPIEIVVADQPVSWFSATSCDASGAMPREGTPPD